MNTHHMYIRKKIHNSDEKDYESQDSGKNKKEVERCWRDRKENRATKGEKEAAVDLEVSSSCGALVIPREEHHTVKNRGCTWLTPF